MNQHIKTKPIETRLKNKHKELKSILQEETKMEVEKLKKVLEEIHQDVKQTLLHREGDPIPKLPRSVAEYYDTLITIALEESEYRAMKAEAEIGRLREVLSFYANYDNYFPVVFPEYRSSKIELDQGEKAKRALGENYGQIYK